MQTVRSRPVDVSTPRPVAGAAGTMAGRAARRRPRLSTGAVYVLLMALATLFAGPFVWLVLAALKSREEWGSATPSILPDQAQWSNFTHALTDVNFAAYALNSLF